MDTQPFTLPTLFIGSRFSRRAEMRRVVNKLVGLGYPIAARWVYGDQRSNTPSGCARQDWADVRRADIAVIFTSPRAEGTRGGGHMAELGIALEAGKEVIVVGAQPNVYTELWNVRVFETTADFLDAMRRHASKAEDVRPTVRVCRVSF